MLRKRTSNNKEQLLRFPIDGEEGCGAVQTLQEASCFVRLATFPVVQMLLESTYSKYYPVQSLQSSKNIIVPNAADECLSPLPVCVMFQNTCSQPSHNRVTKQQGDDTEPQFRHARLCARAMRMLTSRDDLLRFERLMTALWF